MTVHVYRNKRFEYWLLSFSSNWNNQESNFIPRFFPLFVITVNLSNICFCLKINWEFFLMNSHLRIYYLCKFSLYRFTICKRERVLDTILLNVFFNMTQANCKMDPRCIILILRLFARVIIRSYYIDVPDVVHSEID